MSVIIISVHLLEHLGYQKPAKLERSKLQRFCPGPMIEPKFFALKKSTAGTTSSPCSYHSGSKPRNSDQVHLKVIIILGRINWSYKKQAIVEIALLLSRQNIDARFGFKWKRDSVGCGLSKRILRGLEAIRSWEIGKNIIQGGHERFARIPWYSDSSFTWILYLDLEPRVLTKDPAWIHPLFCRDGGIPWQRVRVLAHLSHWWHQWAEGTFPRIPEKCRFDSSFGSETWIRRASFPEKWSML